MCKCLSVCIIYSASIFHSMQHICCTRNVFPAKALRQLPLTHSISFYRAPYLCVHMHSREHSRHSSCALLVSVCVFHPVHPATLRQGLLIAHRLVVTVIIAVACNQTQPSRVPAALSLFHTCTHMCNVKILMGLAGRLVPPSVRAHCTYAMSLCRFEQLICIV